MYSDHSGLIIDTMILIYKYDTQLFSSCHPEKIWVESTLKISQVAPFKNLGRFYRVLLKSLLRVQIKGAYIFGFYLIDYLFL